MKYEENLKIDQLILEGSDFEKWEEDRSEYFFDEISFPFSLDYFMGYISAKDPQLHSYLMKYGGVDNENILTDCLVEDFDCELESKLFDLFAQLINTRNDWKLKMLAELDFKLYEKITNAQDKQYVITGLDSNGNIIFLKKGEITGIKINKKDEYVIFTTKGDIHFHNELHKSQLGVIFEEILLQKNILSF